MLVKPKHNRNVGSALDRGELLNFLARIRGERLEAFYLFCLYTGYRRGEALSVKWCDVDFDENVIKVHGTKTATSDRVVPLLPPLRDVLEKLNRKNALIFNHRAEFVTRKFKTYCPTHKLHDLRHTFATRCLECGINIKGF